MVSNIILRRTQPRWECIYQSSMQSVKHLKSCQINRLEQCMSVMEVKVSGEESRDLMVSSEAVININRTATIFSINSFGAESILRLVHRPNWYKRDKLWNRRKLFRNCIQRNAITSSTETRWYRRYSWSNSRWILQWIKEKSWIQKTSRRTWWTHD